MVVSGWDVLVLHDSVRVDVLMLRGGVRLGCNNATGGCQVGMYERYRVVPAALWRSSCSSHTAHQ